MKRLLEQIGLTYLSALAVVFYFGKIASLVLGVLAIAALMLFLYIKRYRTTVYLPLMAFTALLACIVNLAYTNLIFEDVVEKYNGKSAVVQATLCEEPQKQDGYYRYYFKTDLVDGEKANIKFVSYYDELINIEPYDTVKLQASFRDTQSTRELSKKCFLVGELENETLNIEYIKSEKTPYYYAIKLRESVRSKLSTVLSSDSFSLCSALLLGDKFLLSDEVVEAFRKAGASHVIVVSGMHFSILVFGLLSLAKKNYRIRVLLCAVAVVFTMLYMGVTGFTPSVVRSGVMLLVCAMGISVSADPYPGNSLGLSALVLTVTNPYAVGDIGLILSFASTFAIIKFSPYFTSKFLVRIKSIDYKGENRAKKLTRNLINQTKMAIVNMLCVNISAALITMPLLIFFFSSLSSVSVVSTFLLYLPIKFLLIFALVLSVLCYIPFLSFLVPVISFCVEILTQVTLWVVEFFSSLPFSYIYIKHDFTYVLVITCVVLFIVLLFLKRYIRIRVSALICSLLFLVTYVGMTFLTLNERNLYVYDVENGTAVMYSDKSINAVLYVNCNKSNTTSLIDKLHKTVSDIDFCAGVSNTKNGANCVTALSKSFAISEVLLYDTKRTVSLSEATGNVTEPVGDIDVELSATATAHYIRANNKYITYFESGDFEVLILPQYVDVANIDEKYRSADIIILNDCPENYDLLYCDTLIVSSDNANISGERQLNSICNSLLYTDDGDIETKAEVY